MRKINVIYSLVATMCVVSTAVAQSYSVDWYKIAGGGGASSSGQYSVKGTIGQPDATGAITNGSYSLTGGFWGLIFVEQTVGLPNLIIVRNGPNSVKILWPNAGGYMLQQNSNLAAPSGWFMSSYNNNIITVNGTNSITISSPTGNLFFRLANP